LGNLTAAAIDVFNEQDEGYVMELFQRDDTQT